MSLPGVTVGSAAPADAPAVRAIYSPIVESSTPAHVWLIVRACVDSWRRGFVVWGESGRGAASWFEGEAECDTWH